MQIRIWDWIYDKLELKAILSSSVSLGSALGYLNLFIGIIGAATALITFFAMWDKHISRIPFIKRPKKENQDG